MLEALRRKLYRWIDGLLPPRKLKVVPGDTLPAKMPFRTLVLARDGAEDWCIGFRCPCGCGRTIELLLPEDMSPRWSYMLDEMGHATLAPSVWLKGGCSSHFWVKKGRIQWV